MKSLILFIAIVLAVGLFGASVNAASVGQIIKKFPPEEVAGILEESGVNKKIPFYDKDLPGKDINERE